MATYQATITQTITRVIKVECFELQPNCEFVKDHIREYGVVEAFNDYPEYENLGVQSIMITKVRKVK